MNRNPTKQFIAVCSLAIVLIAGKARACSVIYYVDEGTGNIYVANHEDYWYDTKAYIQVVP